MMKKINKKAQHEIVGFILIVVIVIVIGLFLLVFYLRQEPIRYESRNVQNFLQASMRYTTDCIVSIEPLDLQDLIKSSYKNQKCLNQEMANTVLNNTLPELVSESWQVSEDRPVNAYIMNLYYEELVNDEKGARQEILILEQGNCTGNKAGARHLIPYSPGNIILEMDVCYT